ncbi:MAG: hypothetical protein ILP14_03220, partial [Oscillospiraceae bacterium]|nr:hypothetical protein [Oscillospiraceae bacterium]
VSKTFVEGSNPSAPARKKPPSCTNVIQIMILAARAKELTTDQKVASSLVIRKRVCKTSRCYHLLKYGV